MKAVKFLKFNTKKHKLLKALIETMGIISDACNKVGCDRGTFYNYIKADEVFKAEVEKINDSCVDFVEGKLLQVIKGYKAGDKIIPPDTTAIIFYLKCKGKSRGYIERSQMEFVGDNTMPLTIVERRLGEGESLPEKPKDSTVSSGS